LNLGQFGHISVSGDPINFLFGSRIGFWGLADEMALHPVGTDPSWRPAAVVENFDCPYLCNGLSDPLRVLLGGENRAAITLVFATDCFFSELLQIVA